MVTCAVGSSVVLISTYLHLEMFCRSQRFVVCSYAKLDSLRNELAFTFDKDSFAFLPKNPWYVDWFLLQPSNMSMHTMTVNHKFVTLCWIRKNIYFESSRFLKLSQDSLPDLRYLQRNEACFNEGKVVFRKVLECFVQELPSDSRRKLVAWLDSSSICKSLLLVLLLL